MLFIFTHPAQPFVLTKRFLAEWPFVPASICMFIEHLLILTISNIHVRSSCGHLIHNLYARKQCKTDNGSLPSPSRRWRTNFPNIVLISNFLNIETMQRYTSTEWHHYLKENRYLHTGESRRTGRNDATIVCGHLL